MQCNDHNALIRRILPQILKETATPEAAMVVVESLVMGACLYAASGNPKVAAEYLETMAMGVTERLTTQGSGRRESGR